MEFNIYTGSMALLVIKILETESSPCIPVRSGYIEYELDKGTILFLTSWTLPLLRDGYRRRLERDDLYKIPHHISTDAATQRLQR